MGEEVMARKSGSSIQTKRNQKAKVTKAFANNRKKQLGKAKPTGRGK